MNKLPSIQRVIDLHRLLIAFHGIERQIFLPDIAQYKDRAETDTEHTYTLAMLAWFIADHVPHLDTNKCLRYALVHDLIEIDAGDTFAYDKDNAVHQSKHERELGAKKKLQDSWPDFASMHDAIEAYETQRDAESRFVFAMDKLAPIVLNVLGEGKSWHAHGISLQELKEHKTKKISVSPEVVALFEELIGILEKSPAYFPEEV